MKKWILTMVGMLLAAMSFGQDIVTLMSGESMKVKVEEVSSTEIKYRLFDNLEGPLYTKPIAEIFSITYQNGTTEAFQQSVVLNNNQNLLTVNNNPDPDLERRLRRLKGWSTFLKVYGWIGVGSGIVCIVAGNNMEYDPYYDDFDYPAYYKTLGTMACIEGGVCLAVGYSLQAKRNRLMKENNLVYTTPIISKEFEFKNCTISPSVNLMGYNHNAAEGVGAGLNIRF